MNHVILFLDQNIKDFEGGLGNIFLPDLRKLVYLGQAFQSDFLAFLEKEEKRRTSVKLQEEGISLEDVNDVHQFHFVLDVCVREDHLSFETAILTTDLELFRVDLDDLKIGILSADQLDGLR